MLITAIQIKRLENSGTKMKAVASITLDNMIAIHDIKVLEADEKTFLAMPSKQAKVGTFKDIVHPINANVREAFETLIIGGFKRAEKDCYSKAEYVYSGENKTDLTSQVIEDFTVQGIVGGSSPSFSNNIGSVSKQNSSRVTKSSVDESLLKWLES